MAKVTKEVGSQSHPEGVGSSRGRPSRTDTGRSYHHSVKIADVGGAHEKNPNPKAPFVDPDRGGPIFCPPWKKASRSK